MSGDLFGESAAAPIKALTLHQPWASLMAEGFKTIETRGWPTAYRGPLAIHAAKTIPAYARAAAVSITGLAYMLRAYSANAWNLDGLPRGTVVAIVELVDCKPTVDLDWLPDDQHLFGDLAPGRFGWITRNPRPLTPPIPARGRQRLWDWIAPGAPSPFIPSIRVSTAPPEPGP